MPALPAPPYAVGAQLAAVRGCRHGFYGRDGAKNAAQLFTNRQVHSNRVRVITADTDRREVVDGDGLVTRDAKLALGILSADCAPVLFADPQARVIGAAHAGWRGALGDGVSGVLDAVLAAMTALGARTERIVCAIGPAIQVASYEVGDDFRARFERESDFNCAECFSRDGYFNLPRYVQLNLKTAGVNTIDVLPDDTYADAENFFSYRRSCKRNEPDDGRQLSVIVLE